MTPASSPARQRVLRPALAVFAALSVVTGLLYPLATTALARLAFAHQADGSLVQSEGTTVGSALIGQSFTAPRYFWGRPSATADRPYNAQASGGSNLGPSNPDLARLAGERALALRRADPGNAAPIPVDLVAASGSGLDPHISVAGARYQAPRVARERGLSSDEVEKLIAAHTQRPFIGILGEPVVNVLQLNLALDRQPRS
ncbi:potassium-transporting ATPase subunit KdpC [Pigmentiphaga sp. H8]|uniref:potassium-transporting ATPase subunit KdpC n=1 Tax=Pigmentiphaga sp. H8 TaxID=2488560 RepID=UPI000F5A2F7E|nr:potassium-transporting ATPase subunit KdpC [Pigmentiphaga sp. H8]AZG07868.1 potassium-transporting ATPase subunit KdpC [Pigmentiphaga sp. H8]